MKQPKVTTTPPPAPAPAILRGPRYRYFSTTPATVTLRMRDLQVPEKARAAAYDSEQFVDLPCEDIFRGGPVPKIRLSRLAELAPDCVTAGDLPDEGVKLCSARLALAYVVTESRELIEEPPAPEPPPAPPIEEFAPPTLPQKTSGPAPSTPAAEAEKPKIEPPKSSEPLPEKPAPPSGHEASPRRRWMDAYKARAKTPEPAPDKIPSQAAEAAPKPPDAAAKPDFAPSAPSQKPAAEHPAADTPPPAIPPPAPSPADAKKPFSLFPKFRRKEAEEPKPSTPVPRSRIEIPKPKRPAAPLTAPPNPPLPAESTPPAPASLPVLPLAEKPAAMPPIPPPAAKPSLEPSSTFEPKPPAPVSKFEISPPAAEPAPPAANLPPPPKPPTAATLQPELPAQSPIAEIPPPPPASAAGRPTVPADLPAPIAAPSPVEPPAGGPTPGVESAPAGKPAPVLDPVPAAKPAVLAPPAALLVETEHLPKEKDRPEIAEQDALQAIFLTEEFLSVDRVLELCGNLPGIRSCVLSSGASVIASHNAPDSVDIVSLSAHALEMIKSMRSSAAKMGIGAVPAVTVHSEKGPITFFHQDDLCLLVLHKDRGFVPGVREKLQQVVTELSDAKLPLRLGQGTGKKMLGS